MTDAPGSTVDFVAGERSHAFRSVSQPVDVCVKLLDVRAEPGPMRLVFGQIHWTALQVLMLAP